MSRRLPELQKMMDDGDVSLGLWYAIDLHAYSYGMPLAVEYARHAVNSLPASLPGAGYEKLLADKANLDQETYVNIMWHKLPTLRHLAYAKVIADGTLDSTMLREAAEAYEANFAFVKPRDWDETHQGMAHAAALIALVAGDYARASSLLASKRSFRDTQEAHDLLKRLAADIARDDGRLPPGSPGEEAFQSAFDVLREPEPRWSDAVGGHDPVICRFEFALLKERYVTGNAGAPDLRRVFQSIIGD